MAAAETQFIVLNGSNNVTSDCTFYHEDMTLVDGSVWNDVFVARTSDIAGDGPQPMPLYVEYNGIRYKWEGYTLETQNTSDISDLEGPPVMDRIEFPSFMALLKDHRISGFADSPTEGGPAKQAVGLPVATLDSTSTATAFTATVPGITELRDGVCFIVNNTVITSASGCTFNVNNLGAKPLYMTNAATTRVTTQFAKSNTWMLVYNSTRVSGGCWDLVYLFNTNTTYSLNRVYGAGMLASRVVYRYQLLFTVDDSHLTPMNANSNATGTSKTIHTDWEFDPFGRIYYYATTTTVQAGSAIGTLYYIYDVAADLRYTFNLSASVNPLSTDYGPVYLMIDINSTTGMATLHSTTPLTQTLPNTNDGIYYLLLGMAGTNKYSCSLRNEHPIYYHDGTKLCQLLPPEVRNALPVAPTDVVKYTQQSLTTAQKLQARQNIDADAFVVEILFSLSGLSTSVTYQEVVAAINAHKDIYFNMLSVYMTVNSATFGSESAVLEAYGIAEGSVSNLDGFILTVRVFSNGDPAEVTSTNQSLGTYSKPSGGIPASDLASGVIPTVPDISTDISADGSSDTKTASPKAVKDYVDGHHEIPSGGSQGQVLAKSSGTDYALEWVNQSGGSNPLPTGGTAGQVLAKASGTDYDVEWGNIPSSGTASLPAGGSKGQTLVKQSAIDGDAVWMELYKYGVISQTQTWTGSDAAGYDYTMSDLVRGYIPKANIDIFATVGASFNETTGYFELNGLTDLSYNEMQLVYVKSIGKDRYPNYENRFMSDSERTILSLHPTPAHGTSHGSVTESAINCSIMAAHSYIEVFVWQDEEGASSLTTRFRKISNMNYAFRQCIRLKEVKGAMNVNSVSSAFGDQTFANCWNLQKVLLYGLKVNCPIKYSSRLSLASVVFLVNNAANTTAITITLHATAYARCQADTTEYTYNSNTYTGILAFASAKNITIASA